MMGISISRHSPPAEIASPATCAVYPISVCRNSGIITRLLNSMMPSMNIIRLELAKLKFLNRRTSMMGAF